MTATLLLAVSAAFATKKVMFQYQGAMTPTGCFLGPVEQSTQCTPSGTGPQCTVRIGGIFGTSFPATAHNTGCTVPVFLY